MRRIIFIVAILLPSLLFAQTGEQGLFFGYSKREAMIPMRDGVHLYTAIYEPAGREDAPVMMMRTPYSLAPYGADAAVNLPYMMKEYSDKGYIIVLQNVRGTFLSEGKFEDVRPLNIKASHGAPIVPESGISVRDYKPGDSSDKEIDEATDTYDTIDWLVKNLSTNGCVGVKGSSYPGFYATMAAVCGHPALKAVCPQAPVTDWWMGDDIHHNGAFMLADCYRFGGSFFRAKQNPTTEGKPAVVPVNGDLYEYFKGKPLSDLMAPFGDSLEFMNSIMEHPDYDGFWKERNVGNHNFSTDQSFYDFPAVMVVGGLYDAEDLYGALETFDKIGAHKVTESYPDVHLVLGPWSHGAWNSAGYSHLDDAWFGNGLAQYYLSNIEYPFFKAYLEPFASAVQQAAPVSQAVASSSGKGTDYVAKANSAAKVSKMAGIISDVAGVVSVVAGISSAINGGDSGSGAVAAGAQVISMGADAVSVGAGATAANAADKAERERRAREDSIRAAGGQVPVVTMSAEDLRPALPEILILPSGETDSSMRSHVVTAKDWITSMPKTSAYRFVLSQGTKSLSYVSDPMDPVPYYCAPSNSREKAYMAGDQRFASARQDVLTFTGEVLKDTVTALGPVKADIFVSSTSEDFDLIVKLIDVRPDGNEMLVRGDVMPARYRSSFSKPKAVKPGKVYEISFNMADVAHRFLPGHRIMVQVQSTWFPLVAANPQTFLKNQYKAVSSDYQKAQITVYTSGRHSSNVQFPAVK